MKIYLANSSKQSLGGGWSWISNFRKGMGELVTDKYDEADVYLVPSPTMVQREEVQKAKLAGKKIVLRIDNAVRNSRNRNTGMTRMKDFAEWADLVIFQSAWAERYLIPFLDIPIGKTVVIMNGVDGEVFHARNRKQDSNIYLYSRYNRDETKNWEMARYIFSQIHVERRGDCQLWIAGQFSPELVESNFDFYNDESYRFLGVQDYHTLADIYRQSSHLIYTYFNDACSNTLIEALCCGCEILDPYKMSETGGAFEIVDKFQAYGPYYFDNSRMCDEYKEAIVGIL